MIKYFYSESASAPIEELKDFKEGAWVSVEDPTEKEIEMLVKTFDLSADYVEDSLDENETPRLEHYHGNLYLFTRYMCSEDKCMHTTTKPILYIIYKNTLITISKESCGWLDSIMKGDVDAVTIKAVDLMFSILNEMTEKYEIALIEISRQVKSVRSRLRSQEITNRDFILFARIEDELNEFMSALLPTNAIYRRLSTGRHIHIDEHGVDFLEDLTLNNEQTMSLPTFLFLFQLGLQQTPTRPP